MQAQCHSERKHYAKGLCKSCYSIAWNSFHKERVREYVSNYNKEGRRIALDYYGNRCSKCGYNQDLRALDFDHINNDGANFRKTVSNIGPWLVRNDFPEEFQLLCRNCNWIKELDRRNR